MKIDTHGHFFPRPYLEALAEFRPALRARIDSPISRAAGDPNVLLAAMDDAGVDHTVIGIGSHQPWMDSREGCVRVATLCNDLYAETVAAASGRLSAIGCLPLPHVEEAIAEAHRCRDELGFKGYSFGTAVGQIPLDDARFEPLWEELNKQQAVVQLHPVQGPAPAEFGLDAALQGPGQVCMACARLALSGVTIRYPGIRFIATCLGGSLPFLFDRVIRFYTKDPIGRPYDKPLIDAAAALRGFYYDTECATAAALKCTCEVAGVDKVIFGTNYPFENAGHDIAQIEQSGLSPASVEAILGTNAAALFNIPPRSG